MGYFHEGRFFIVRDNIFSGEKKGIESNRVNAGGGPSGGKEGRLEEDEEEDEEKECRGDDEKD